MSRCRVFALRLLQSASLLAVLVSAVSLTTVPVDFDVGDSAEGDDYELKNFPEPETRDSGLLAETIREEYGETWQQEEPSQEALTKEDPEAYEEVVTNFRSFSRKHRRYRRKRGNHCKHLKSLVFSDYPSHKNSSCAPDRSSRDLGLRSRCPFVTQRRRFIRRNDSAVVLVMEDVKCQCSSGSCPLGTECTPFRTTVTLGEKEQHFAVTVACLCLKPASADSYSAQTLSYP